MQRSSSPFAGAGKVGEGLCAGTAPLEKGGDDQQGQGGAYVESASTIVGKL